MAIVLVHAMEQKYLGMLPAINSAKIYGILIPLKKLNNIQTAITISMLLLDVTNTNEMRV